MAKLQFFTASRAHHADVGGMSPGSLPLSTEIFQEGIIIPPIKVMRGGQYNDDVLNLIIANSRTPEERLGDLKAQVSAQIRGAQRLHELVQKYGLTLVNEHIEALIDFAQRITSAAIEQIPDGVYQFQDFLEGDGQKQYRLPIHATITVNHQTMNVDFSGSAPQVLGNVNAPEAIVKSAVWYCVRLLIDEDLPMNHGGFAPITVNIPPQSILNASYPAAVSTSTTETSQRVVDVVLGALAQALPDKIPAASQGTMNNITFGGQHRQQTYTFYETLGGGHGASPNRNGLDGRQSHMTNTRNTPIEVIEATYPVRILAYEIRDNSGGVGKFRGGDGLRRIYEFLAPAVVTLNTERRTESPYGLQGGSNGHVGINRLIRQGREIILEGRASVQAEIGDILIIETPGGGGWGDGDSIGFVNK